MHVPDVTEWWTNVPRDVNECRRKRTSSLNCHYYHRHNIILVSYQYRSLNSSIPGQNDRHFGRREFQMHFVGWNDRILIRISLKFVPRSPIDNMPALVQIMAWCRTGDKHSKHCEVHTGIVCYWYVITTEWLPVYHVRNYTHYQLRQSILATVQGWLH